MRNSDAKLRVLYSFPHKLGAARICTTAWHQVDGLSNAGADVLACPGVLQRPFATPVEVHPTLARGTLRIPYKILGRLRALALHDYIVSRRVEELVGRIDIIHTWPLGALRTLKAAARLGIPTVLERPNAHTRFAYAAVEQECAQLGLRMPVGHEHAYNSEILSVEQKEYDLASYILCPSDFVLGSFLDKGFSRERLIRHQYGYDEQLYYPGAAHRESELGLRMLFVGGCAPRKGLHYALRAWLGSKASERGKFRVVGTFIPGYAEVLGTMLSHQSVEVLGHRNDIPELMRQSDILILPSIEEGSALVTYEARGSGCVLLVSEAAGAICQHGVNALIHRVGDVEALSCHIALLDMDRDLLRRMRSASLQTSGEITWRAAGRRLAQAYRHVIETFSSRALGYTVASGED